MLKSKKALLFGQGLVYDTAWPSMTGFSSPAGYVMSSSEEGYYDDGAGNITNYYSWYTHDGNIAGLPWRTNSGAMPAWLRIQFPTKRKMVTYTIWPYSTTTATPTAWKLQGSNDGTTWSDLDTRTHSSTWPTSETFTVASPDGYLYYRLYITAVTSSTYPLIYEWQATFSAS